MTYTQPGISTQIVRHIRDCLELAGVASGPLLEASGIQAAIVDEREQKVALRDYVCFFEVAAQAAGNAHFGLHAARLMSADGLGPLSFLFLSAPTLGHAFQTFTEYLDTMQESTFNAFELKDQTSHFTYGIRLESITQRRQDTEYSLGVMCNLMRQYVGRRSPPIEVHFEHERIGALGWYESYFDCPVYFEQPFNRIYLPVSALEQGSSALSSALFPIIAEHLKQRMHADVSRSSVTEKVRNMLLASAPDALPALDEAADRMGMSRATLMRQLAAENQRYGLLLQERRLGFARHLLDSSRRSIADIALAAGYAETASFTRAYARWFGQTPSASRKAHARSGPAVTSAPSH